MSTPMTDTTARPGAMHDAVTEIVTRTMRLHDTVCTLGAVPTDRAAFDAADPATWPQAERRLHKEFGPWRVMQMPYAPHTVIGAAFGAAESGLRVVADLTGIDHPGGLIDELARQTSGLRTGQDRALPLVIRLNADRDPAETRRAAAFAASAAGLDVAVPATLQDARGLMIEALRRDRPCLFLESTPQAFGPVPAAGAPEIAPAPLPFGCARVLREGLDLTLIAFGPDVPLAQETARLLEAHFGLDCTVIDPRTAAPLDMRVITDAVERTGRVALIEPGAGRCPLGTEIAARLAEGPVSSLLMPVKRLAAGTGPRHAAALMEELAIAVNGRL